MHQEGILGVLGGMGPQATNTFYQRIIDRTQAESDQEHLRVLIWSDAKIPDRTAGILGTPDQAEAVYQHLLADAKLLERAGCTVLAIPCNTSHYFADRLQGELHIPLIHMIRETVSAIRAMGAGGGFWYYKGISQQDRKWKNEAVKGTAGNSA